MPFLKQHNQTENFMEALVLQHQKYRPIVDFLDKVVEQSDSLTWLELEDIAVTVSEQNCSGFCSGIHISTREGLRKLAKKGGSSRLEQLIPFCEKLNENPKNIVEEDINRLREAGFSDATVEDVVSWVAIINFYNITANGLGFAGKLNKEAYDGMGAGTIEFGGFLPIFDHFAKQIR